MFDWFSTCAAAGALPAHAASELDERGFVVLPGPVPSERMGRLADANTAVLESATGPDIRIGSIGQPFKLSSFAGRTLRPHTAAQELHVDVRRESADWPLIGFILMVDEFRPDNGATRFIPGSQHWSSNPEDVISDPRAKHDDQVFACGPAGSMIVFHGSTWHGHSENESNGPRRSLQGAFIPRPGRSGTDFAARMQPDTRARLSELARYVLAL